MASFASGPKANAVTSNFERSWRSNSCAASKDTGWPRKSAEKYPILIFADGGLAGMARGRYWAAILPESSSPPPLDAMREYRATPSPERVGKRANAPAIHGPKAPKLAFISRQSHTCIRTCRRRPSKYFCSGASIAWCPSCDKHGWHGNAARVHTHNPPPPLQAAPTYVAGVRG